MEQINLERLREQLEKLVKTDSNERFEVRRERLDGGVTGYLVRKDWRGVSPSQRQRQLSEFLEEHFGAAAADVSLILTFTPEEYEAWAEDQLAPS
jgi:hypothetical protein